ncbi:MAG: hypothetical protein COB60_11275 [Flavobacteriaceae bacterium]|nr:MAG: hypothetical protein COB60_11275 [Flavobacteriaceae bacterium]
MISCNEEKEEIISYNVTVIGKGLDCGETFLIKFNDNIDGLIDNSFDNVFYAINLYDEYKIESLQIKVTFREPLVEELLSCTTFGPAYPQIFIIETQR